MSHLDSFSAIPVFVAVVESGSFSAAGQRLGITKSAVSKRISQLEETLGGAPAAAYDSQSEPD